MGTCGQECPRWRPRKYQLNSPEQQGNPCHRAQRVPGGPRMAAAWARGGRQWARGVAGEGGAVLAVCPWRYLLVTVFFAHNWMRVMRWLRASWPPDTKGLPPRNIPAPGTHRCMCRPQRQRRACRPHSVARLVKRCAAPLLRPSARLPLFRCSSGMHTQQPRRRSICARSCMPGHDACTGGAGSEEGRPGV